MSEFNWGLIKEGFRGFEKLAYRYVEKTFPNLSNPWIKTPDTKDGNRDAYTIVLGFKPYSAKNEQWWMEAKYSNEQKILSRYRLDATIVSAILDGNVSKVIFVTNIQVASKTIVDIRHALKRATNCRDVIFCLKNTLELWLHNNFDIYKEFFNDFEKYNYIPPEILITEEIEFYTKMNQHMAFKEPMFLLYPNTYYTGYFTVFSNNAKTLNFKPDKFLKGKFEYSPKHFKLEPGDNQLQFSFCFNQQIKDTNWQPNFTLGTHKVLTKRSIDFTSHSNTEIEISSQRDIFKDFKTKINIFNKTLTPLTYCIIGDSGTGKSHLLNKIINEWSSDNIFFYQVFSDSITDNNNILVEIVLFILFPFVSPKDIDLKYINAIKNNNYISEAIKNIVEHKQSVETLGDIFSGEEDLFPVSMSISPRFIILDDVHKLNQTEKHFILKLINNIRINKTPIFFLLSGQPKFFTDKYLDYKKRCTVYEKKCELNKYDIIKYLKNNKLMKYKINTEAFEFPFQTVMELFIFTKHLDMMGKEICSLKEFLFACRQFYIDKISEQYLLNKFYMLNKHYSELREFVNAVYWSENGIRCNYSDLQTIDKNNFLLKERLVEYCEENVIPTHDIYVRTYRECYKLIPGNKYLQNNQLQSLRFSITQNNDFVNWSEVIDKINELMKKQQNHTIMYILEDTFENMELSEICQWMGKDVFYTLYMIYAQVSTHIGIKHSGRALFEKIRNETKGSLSLSLINVNEDATWEVLNSSYEWLEYKESEILISELLQLVRQLQKYGKRDPDIFKCIRYHDAMVIQTLIDSDMDKIKTYDVFFSRYEKMLENNFDYRAQSFKVRYALTLLHSSPDLALKMLKECMDDISNKYGQDDKYYLWSAMCYYFMQVVYKKNFPVIEQVVMLHEKMRKNFYNDYRKKLLALANYYFSQNEIEKGINYLFSDIHVERAFRPRQKGFYLSTIALNESIGGNYNEAINTLKESKTIFSHIPSYLKIIEHNLSLLKTKKFDVQKIEFSFGDCICEDVFYIDPRCIW